jgi:hypothetical protein
MVNHRLFRGVYDSLIIIKLEECKDFMLGIEMLLPQIRPVEL